MGFMDKLRSMAAVVTGGSAKVRVEAVNPAQDGSFTVNVQAEIASADVKIKKVYLKLMGVETVTLEVDMPVIPKPIEAPVEEAPTTRMGKDFSKRNDAGSEVEAETKEPTSVKKKISRSEQTHLQEFEVAGEQTLSANQTYAWDIEIQLPDDAKPRYQGIHATHDWKILVGLDTFGNDPDSGWQVLDF